MDKLYPDDPTKVSCKRCGKYPISIDEVYCKSCNSSNKKLDR